MWVVLTDEQKHRLTQIHDVYETTDPQLSAGRRWVEVAKKLELHPRWVFSELPQEMRPCGDCLAMPGQLHMEGCDVERCEDCGGQRISCDCEEDTDTPRIPWTGLWPGKAECQEFGWWSKWVDGKGWVRCDADDPDKGEDLNRLYMGEAVWDKAQARWVLR